MGPTEYNKRPPWPGTKARFSVLSGTEGSPVFIFGGAWGRVGGPKREARLPGSHKVAVLNGEVGDLVDIPPGNDRRQAALQL